MTTYAPPKLRHTLAEAAFRRKNTLLLTFCVVGGLVCLLVLLLPAQYRASAKLLVQNMRSQAPLTTSPADRTLQSAEVSSTEVNSEVDLLGSVGVMRRALGQNPAAPETEADEEQVKKLHHRLTVEAVHQTDNIDVTIAGRSAESARQQLKALLSAYFEERSEAARSGGAAEFFDRQVQDKGRMLDADQQALTTFEMQHGIADLDDQKKLQVERIAGIEDQQRATEASLAQQRSRTVAEKHQLALTPARSRTVERSITNQYSQERLNTSLVDLQNQRSELLKRYVPTDRQIVALNEKIATTQRAIQDAQAQPAGETATDVNPVWQTLTAAVATSSGELSGLNAQRDELQRQRKQAEARLDELEQATTTFNTLQRSVTQAQADYTAYAQKRDEARVAEALDREKMFDVALVEPPTASPDSRRCSACCWPSTVTPLPSRCTRPRSWMRKPARARWRCLPMKTMPIATLSVIACGSGGCCLQSARPWTSRKRLRPARRVVVAWRSLRRPRAKASQVWWATLQRRLHCRLRARSRCLTPRRSYGISKQRAA